MFQGYIGFIQYTFKTQKKQPLKTVVSRETFLLITFGYFYGDFNTII